MNKLRQLLVPKRIPSALLIALLILIFVSPAFSGDYVLYMIERILILCIFSFSVNLLLGYMGLLSFGQGLFYAVGAYTYGKILLAYPNLLLGLVGGLVIAGVAAFILGWFCVRHTRIYFSMITLAFGMMGYTWVDRWPWLGGRFGLTYIPEAPIEIPHIFSISMTSELAKFYFVVIVALIAIFIFYRLVHSPLGLTFQGIRDSESRIAFTGISVRNTRWLCFVIAGMYAGLAGVLYVFVQLSVGPLATHWSTSTEPIIATLLGGMYTFSGPIVGSTVYFVVREVILRYTTDWMLPVGVIVVALVLGMRGGVVGTIEQRLLPRLKRAFAQRSSHEQSNIKH